MLFSRRIVTLALVLIIALGLVLNRSVVLAAAYTSASAYHLAQALAGLRPSPSHLQRSWKLALRALEWQPQSVSACRLALRALVEDGQLPGAESLDPSALLPKADSLAILYAGQVIWNSGDPQRAIELWRSGKRLDSYFMHLGNQAYNRGDARSAMGYYETSCALDDTLDSGKLQMYSNRCNYETRQQNSAEAILWCSRAVQVQRTVWTLLALGQAFYTAGEYDTALSTLEQARSLDPQVATVYYRLGLTYEKRGEASLALSHYERGLELAPTNEYLNWAAGRLYERGGQLEKAYCCYLRAAGRGASQALEKKASEALQRLSALVPAQACDDR